MCPAAINPTPHDSATKPRLQRGLIRLLPATKRAVRWLVVWR